jgi:hydrogenase/urease accessory protein HupE
MRTLAALLGAMVATPAAAHGTLAGAEGFYAGALHPVLAWDHFLLLLALGALLGRQPHRPVGALIGLAVGLGSGLALGTAGVSWPLAPLIIAASAALGGAAVAVALPAGGLAIMAFATVGGVLIGIDTGVPGSNATAGDLGLYAGVFAGVLLIVIDTMGLTFVAHRPPYAIAFRVAGSWIAAAAVMMLALHLRSAGGA